MKLNFIKLLIIFCLFLSISCDYFDIWGFLASSPVDDRYKQKDNLKMFNAPVITDTNNFKFIVVTDTHYYNTQLDAIKNIESNKTLWNISYIVVDGDIVQDGLKKNYDLALEDFSKTSLPIFTVIGNHDLYNNGFEIYKNVFGRTIYDIKIGNILHMIFIDTANGTIGELQKNWLENALKNSTSKYKIVFTHYSPTDDTVWETFTTMSYPDDSYYLFDLLDTYNVDYCISGHLHVYDYKEIRGVKYIIVNNIQGTGNTHLLFTIKDGLLGYSTLK